MSSPGGTIETLGSGVTGTNELSKWVVRTVQALIHRAFFPVP